MVYSKLRLVLQLEEYAVTKFIVPDWGDKVDSGMGLSYRPARLHRLAGRYDNPMPYVAWRAGTTTLCRSQLYPLGRDYEFGYYFILDKTEE